MHWHFPCLLLATVTLPSACLQFNPRPLEELGSDIGIQVFHQIVKSRPRDNIIVSPHGIASALGVLQLGASGRTKLQLAMMMKYNVNGACAGPWLRGRAGVTPGPVPGGFPAGSLPTAPRSKQSNLGAGSLVPSGVQAILLQTTGVVVPEGPRAGFWPLFCSSGALGPSPDLSTLQFSHLGKENCPSVPPHGVQG